MVEVQRAFVVDITGLEPLKGTQVSGQRDHETLMFLRFIALLKTSSGRKKALDGILTMLSSSKSDEYVEIFMENEGHKSILYIIETATVVSNVKELQTAINILRLILDISLPLKNLLKKLDVYEIIFQLVERNVSPIVHTAACELLSNCQEELEIIRIIQVIKHKRAIVKKSGFLILNAKISYMGFIQGNIMGFSNAIYSHEVLPQMCRALLQPEVFHHVCSELTIETILGYGRYIRTLLEPFVPGKAKGLDEALNGPERVVNTICEYLSSMLIMGKYAGGSALCNSKIYEYPDIKISDNQTDPSELALYICKRIATNLLQQSSRDKCVVSVCYTMFYNKIFDSLLLRIMILVKQFNALRSERLNTTFGITQKWKEFVQTSDFIVQNVSNPVSISMRSHVNRDNIPFMSSIDVHQSVFDIEINSIEDDISSYVNCVQNFCHMSQELRLHISNLSTYLNGSISIKELSSAAIDGVPDISALVNDLTHPTSFESGVGYHLTKRLYSIVSPFDKIALMRRTLDLALHLDLQLIPRNKENKLVSPRKAENEVKSLSNLKKKVKKKKVSYRALMDAVIRTSENGCQTVEDAALLEYASKVISEQHKEKLKSKLDTNSKVSMRVSSFQSKPVLLATKRRNEKADDPGSRSIDNSSVILMEDSVGKLHIADDLSGSVRRRPAVYVASSSRVSTEPNSDIFPVVDSEVSTKLTNKSLISDPVPTQDTFQISIGEMVDMDLEFLLDFHRNNPQQKSSHPERLPKPPPYPQTSNSQFRKKVSIRQHHEL